MSRVTQTITRTAMRTTTLVCIVLLAVGGLVANTFPVGVVQAARAADSGTFDPDSFELNPDPAAIGDPSYRAGVLAAYTEATKNLDASLALREELTAQAARLTEELQPVETGGLDFARDGAPGADVEAGLLRPAGTAEVTLLEQSVAAAGETTRWNERAVLIAQISQLDLAIERASASELRLRDEAATVLRFERQKAEAEAYVLSQALEANSAREAALAAAEAARANRVTNHAYVNVTAGASYGVVQWAPLIRRYFPERLWEEALSVMWCESRGDPNAANPTSDARGLFQHKLKYWAPRATGAGFDGASVFNPEANIAAAAQLALGSERAGQDTWAHWACKP